MEGGHPLGMSVDFSDLKGSLAVQMSIPITAKIVNSSPQEEQDSEHLVVEV